MKNSRCMIFLLTAVFLAFMLGVFLGRSNWSDSASFMVERKSQSAGLVDLNNATIDELCLLPGISEITAQKIIDYRQQEGPFRTIEDLCNISGISRSKLEQIKEFIKV